MLAAMFFSITAPTPPGARTQPLTEAPSPPPASSTWVSRFHSTVLWRTTMPSVWAIETVLWWAP